LESAVGGVLFIDEAYSLVQGKQDQYGYEAAEEILAFMENRKSELSVIIAGYPEEINKFFKTNPAFQRRCNVPILFEN
jgi:ATP-dependent Clp protease ATP-binding subunit ClpA